MILKKDKIIYHGNEYEAVWVTLENGEQTADTKAGVPLLFADIELWLDIVGEETLNSDKEDAPQDYEGEKIDEKVYYYDLSVSCFCLGEISEKDFKKWAYECID